MTSALDLASAGPGGPIFEAFLKWYGLKKIIKHFGNFGKVAGFVDSALGATTWNQWAKVGLDGFQTISKVNHEDINQIIFRRFEDEERVEFLNKLSFFLKNSKTKYM